MSNPRRSALFRPLVAADLIRLAGQRPIVVIAPHPDDETLGCGLLIARGARAGRRVVVVALSDGQASHPNSRRWPPGKLARLRRSELRRAMARLGAGAARCVFLGWPDGDVAGRGKARSLARVLRSIGPGVVCAASPADHHPDHKAGWALTSAALRGTDVPLIAYAVWSRVHSHGPAVRDPGRAAKRWAVAAHRSQTSHYIDDDPQGFVLSPTALSALVGEAEYFTRAPNSMRRALPKA